MDFNLIDKLCLGTTQFGLDYGIANRTGQIAREEVFKILDYASKIGLNTLDTAYSYGTSDEIVGEYRSIFKKDFNIISKLPFLNEGGNSNAEKLCRESLARLKCPNLYGYLIHKFDNFLRNNELWDILQKIKAKKLIKKIGFTLYRPQGLEIILDKKLKFDILQIPYSIFDRRFEKYFKILENSGVEICVRSVFLQGLVFLGHSNLPKSLREAQSYLERLEGIALENDISINALCLNFALLNPHINKAVIGVDSLNQLKRNVEDTGLIQKVRNIYHRLDELKIENENLLVPYKW